MLSLHVPGGSKGPGQPDRILLSDHRVTTLGRLQPKDAQTQADEQFIVLDSPTLKNLTSRSHLRITQRILDSDSSDLTFAYNLEDLASMNGVLVNNVKVKSVDLAEGDTIVIGAAKQMAFGEVSRKDVTAASDLVYVFHADPNYQGKTQAEPKRTSSFSLKAIAPTSASASSAASNGQLSRDNSNPAPLQRSYSFKPSAKSRRSAVPGPESSEEPMELDSSADVPASSAAAASSPRPKMSLAQQLLEQQAAATAAAEAAAASAAKRRKRAREAEAADSDAVQGEEKKQRTAEPVVPDEAEIARRNAEIEAKTAAAVESALAAANTNAAAASKAVASEARQALASELSDEFQCAICCDLLVHAMALSCSHTFCKSCIAQWLLKGGTSGKGNLTCPQCRGTIEAEPIPVKTLDNVIDRIAATSLTPEEQQERKDKLATDAKLVVPKIFEKGKAKKKRGALVMPPAPAPIAPAAAPGGFGFGLGGFAFPAFGFGGRPIAAAPAAPIAVDDDDEEEEDDDEDDDDDDVDEEESGDLDVWLEHAPSGRAQCRGCRGYIGLREARFAVRTRDRYEYYESVGYWHMRCYASQVNRVTHPRVETIKNFSVLTPAEKNQLRGFLPDVR